MCPVSGGLALSAMAVSAGTVAAGSAAATAIAVVGGAAIGAGIGVAAAGAMNLATGRGFFEGAGKSALFGAVSGGIGTYATPFAQVAAMGGGGFTGMLAGYAASAGSVTAIGLSAAGGSLLRSMTPDYSGYTPISQAVQQQNSQNIATTGSGGKQATASLAEAIKRSKKRKLTQEDVGDLSIDTGSFANTGLQLA